MRNIKVLLDSCSDLPEDLLKEYDIDYCRMNTVKDGIQTPASLEWEYYSPQDLYNAIRQGERITTTQVPVDEFLRVFKLYLEKGMDIIYIGCCSKQSGSVNTAGVVVKELLADYPDARISVIDANCSSIGQGMLGMEAAKMVHEGKNLDEITEKIMGLRNYVNQYVTVNTLEYLKRAGRVKGSKAFFGNLMGVKPILISDADGEQTPVKKAKGRLNSFNEIVSMAAESITDPANATLYIAHADCSTAEIDMLKDLIRERIGVKEIKTVYIGPIIGASIGPDAIGIWCWGKEVTYRVAEEK